MKRMILGVLAFFGWVAAGIWLAALFLKGRVSYGLAQLIVSVLFVVMGLFILFLSDWKEDWKKDEKLGRTKNQ